MSFPHGMCKFFFVFPFVFSFSFSKFHERDPLGVSFLLVHTRSVGEKKKDFTIRFRSGTVCATSWLSSLEQIIIVESDFLMGKLEIGVYVTVSL